MSSNLAESANPEVDIVKRRDLRLDACRGLALWFIFLDHVPNNIFAWLTLRNYGFSDTTEVFVFVSGYTCALAYGGALPERGWVILVTRTLRRSWEIYVSFLLLVIIYLALIQAIGAGLPYIDETNTAIFFQNPGPAIFHVLTMQYTPVNTDVLPTFVLLHLTFPAILFVIMRAPLLGIGSSFLLYVLVQIFGWNLPAWPREQWFFNPLAWQVLFVFGVWMGTGGAAILKPVLRSKTVVTVAIVYLIFSFAVTMSWQFKSLEIMPEFLSKLIYPIDKSNLALPRLLHFSALAVIVARFILPDWKAFLNPLMVAAIRCGENSLIIYCLGVVLSLVAHVMLVEIAGGLAMQLTISVTGIALMIVSAMLMTWMARLGENEPKLF